MPLRYLLGLENYCRRLFCDAVRAKLPNRHPSRIVGIRCTGKLATAAVAQKVDDDEVVLDTAVGCAPDAIQHFHKRSDPHDEAGLFEHLTCDGLLEGLAQLHPAPGQAPLTLQRFVAALDEEHAIAIEDDRADADDWPRLARQTPITFTTTRFLRRPSNSA